jgi:Uma2 family endonuclease
VEPDPRIPVLLEEVGEVEHELIEGELFTSAVPTERLAAVIAGAALALEAALRDAGLPARVVSQEPLLLGPRTLVRPDAAALPADEGPPLLVVEVRTESTERYALGPKRMAYARAGVPEYWFVDPSRELVVALRSVADEPDYPWPGEELGRGTPVTSAAHPGVRVPVDDLLGAPRAARVAGRT